jgi:xanthine/uracil/vitamin C permease (AzgA family)
MASAYILFLNPLILSGNSIGFPTGMPAEDVTLATTFSTGAATAVMGLVANYPWYVMLSISVIFMSLDVFFIAANTFPPFPLLSFLLYSSGSCQRSSEPTSIS